MKALVPLEKFGGLERLSYLAQPAEPHGQSHDCRYTDPALAE